MKADKKITTTTGKVNQEKHLLAAPPQSQPCSDEERRLLLTIQKLSSRILAQDEMIIRLHEQLDQLNRASISTNLGDGGRFFH